MHLFTDARRLFCQPYISVKMSGSLIASPQFFLFIPAVLSKVNYFDILDIFVSTNDNVFSGW